MAKFLMPSTIWHADFFAHDCEELTPEWESRDCGNMSERRDVERINPVAVDGADADKNGEHPGK